MGGRWLDVIVVGVDGSEGAGAALRFAAEEAVLRGASLHVVCTWDVPVGVVTGSTFPPLALGDFEQRAQEIVDDAVADVGRRFPDLACTGAVVHGNAAASLVDAATADDLIVVGTRGRGGFAGLVLGSVGQQVVHHARCPVVVVR